MELKVKKKMMRIAVISLTIAFCFSIGIAGAQNISNEALRHFNRGTAAVGRAKSPADYEFAIREFKKATRLAPAWPDAYYNLGLIQEKIGRYGNAIRNLRKYLKLSPNAKEAGKVKKFITKIEHKNINAKSKDGDTALIKAASDGRIQKYRKNG